MAQRMGILGLVQQSSSFDVRLDPVALQRERALHRRTCILSIPAFACILLTEVLLLFQIAAAYDDLGEFARGVVGAIFAVLSLLITVGLVPTTWMLIACVRTVAGQLDPIGFPADPPPALFIDHTGIWLPDGTQTGRRYPWESVRRFARKRDRRRGDRLRMITAKPATGSYLVGVQAAHDPYVRLLRALGLRHPRLAVKTLAVDLPTLDSALRHYSQGRVGLS